jgi:Fe-S-cluster containining protein
MHVHNLPPGYERLEPADSFAFACRKELSCFGSCCRNRDLRLTPYDVLRLRGALKLHSDDFLSRYTLYTLDPATGFPAISIKLAQDALRQCPFLKPEGCSVYEDRPTVCRLFPLARVSGFKPDSTKHDEFFYMLPAGGCLGGAENKVQTVQDWLESQGVAPYRKANDKMLHLLFHPERGKDRALSDGQIQKIIVACYNLDVFRDFVFGTSFLDVFAVDAETRTRIGEEDYELLMLGFAYLRTTLFSGRHE